MAQNMYRRSLFHKIFRPVRLNLDLPMQFIAREGEAPAEPWRGRVRLLPNHGAPARQEPRPPVVYQTNWRCKVLTGGTQELRLSLNQTYSNRTGRNFLKFSSGRYCVHNIHGFYLNPL